MKPVESYRGISPRMDHPSTANAAAKVETAKAGVNDAADQVKKQDAAAATTAARLAEQKAPFDVAKVNAVKAQIASGKFSVDTDALATKMLEMGVFGMESKK